MLAVATLVAAATLGSVYAFGRTLGTPDADRTGSGVGSSASPTAPPGPATPTPTQPAVPDVPPGPAQLSAEAGGPFGARITTGTRGVALTFDDGPDPSYTPQALAILRRYHLKATFCLVGTNAAEYPNLVRAIAADGHSLCNHSWAHDVGLGSSSASTIVRDLVRTNQAIRAAVPGARIAYFRQPGGNWTPSVVAVARQLGMTSLHWTVDPQDWTVPGAGNITAMVTASTFPGSIVLLHDAGGNRQGTMNALRSILPNLIRRFDLAALPTGVPSAGPQNQTLPRSPGPM